MTMNALKARLETLIHTDWKGKARQVIDERRESGQGKVSSSAGWSSPSHIDAVLPAI